MEPPRSLPFSSKPTTNEEGEAPLQFPVFDHGALPPPEQSMEEWMEWLDWCRVHLIGPEKFACWALEPERAPVEVAFVLRGS